MHAAGSYRTKLTLKLQRSDLCHADVGTCTPRALAVQGPARRFTRQRSPRPQHAKPLAPCCLPTAI
jgi:hypothetical protein